MTDTFPTPQDLEPTEDAVRQAIDEVAQLLRFGRRTVPVPTSMAARVRMVLEQHGWTVSARRHEDSIVLTISEP